MTKLRLGLEWFLNPDHLPFLIAFQKGWFDDAGLEIEMIEPEEHLDAVEEIESGEMDLAVTEPLHLVEDATAGKDVVGITRFLHTNGGVMYLEKSGIDRPRDMAGARIQYPGAPGPGGPAIVGTMIEADGGEYDPEGFEPVNNGFYHTDALVEGKADVATLAFYNFEMVEARHRGAEPQFFALKDWGVPDFCQLILITSPQLLDEKRDEFDAFLQITQRGLDFAHQHPQEARDIYFQRTETDDAQPLTNKIFDATVPCFTFDFSMSGDYYADLQDWMYERGLVETERAPAEFWTNELVFD